MAFALTPVVVGLGSAEVYVRHVGLVSEAYESGGDLGWTARPGLENYRFQTRVESAAFEVTTNADGLRTSHQRVRPPDQKRVMVFGESTVFGWGVPEEAVPAVLLEGALGPGWQVINGGQPGYTSEQVSRLSQLAVPAYRPDVVIMFHTWNDLRYAERGDRAFLPEHAAVARHAWWSKSMLMRWLLEAEEGDASLEIPRHNPLVSFREALPGESVRVSSEERAENIDAVAAICRKYGVEFVLAMLPPGAPGITQRTVCPDHFICTELQMGAERAGAPFFDLTPALAGWSEELLLLYQDPGHFTALGNQALMQYLAALLLESQKSGE